MKDQMPCADYLLSLDNVDVNFPDDCGRTLLCQKLRCSALNKALVEKITYLVEKKGADVNKADVEQWTPVSSFLLPLSRLFTVVIQASCMQYKQETIKGTERASPIYTLFHR